MNKKILAASLVAATLAGTAAAAPKVVNKVQPSDNQYVMVIHAYDEAPSVDRVIINAGKTITAKDVKAADFTVITDSVGFDWGTFQVGPVSGERTVTGAFLSDANGNKVGGKSNYITLDLARKPDDGLSNPFIFGGDMMNHWNEDSYANTITNSKLGLNISECTGKVCPVADQFTMGKGTYAGVELNYASFEPAKHGKKVPLIIWLHGMGEGGTDPYIALLGNKVENLATPEIQKNFGKDGAYVLVAQANGFWLQTSLTEPFFTTGAQLPGTPAQSCYTEPLMELIKEYVAANPSVDPNRIYIGGCSNGGYMTMNMIIEYPDYFAAAYPTCEAYLDSKITDEDIAKIAKQNVWFTWACTDTTVNPDEFERPTRARLEAAGAANCVFTEFADVHDLSGKYFKEDGTPYEYNGHYSWIYVLNNQCVANGQTIFQWMAKQSK